MKHLFFSISILLITTTVFSQNKGVGIGTSNPNTSAALEISSVNKGFLPPRMTTAQRNSIQNPAVGLQIYNLTTHCVEIYDFGKWNAVHCITPDSTQLDIDGNFYPTVKICDQTWMAKNLEVSRYRNGDTIPKVTDPAQWASLTTGAWCWYNNDSTNGAVYGKLYNWYAVNDPRGLAPAGWHVPTDAEWNTMIKCADPNVDTSILGWQNSDAGGKLKSTSYWNAPNTGATNSLQFNALPGGRCFSSGSFSNLNNNGYWWSSSEFSSQFAWMRYLSYSNADVHRFQFNKVAGFSVRCVKDTPITTLNNGLVAYYPFSGNAGDSSGNGNHGTVNGATLTTDRFGNAGKAYYFNYFDEITTNFNQISGTQPRTFSFWMKNQNSHKTITPIWYGGGNNAYPGYVFNIKMNRNEQHDQCQCWPIVYEGVGIDGAWTNIIYSAIIGDNQWHNYVYVVENSGNTFGQVKIYQDGNLLSQTANIIFDYNNNSSNLINTLSESPLKFGRSMANQGYPNDLLDRAPTEYLDDIRIYNRALTQAEITYLATH